MVVPISRIAGRQTQRSTAIQSPFLLFLSLFLGFSAIAQGRTRLETPPPTFTVGGFHSDFGSIQAAVSAAPEEGAIIRVRPGVYRERIRITHSNIQLRGEGHDPSKVVLIFASPDSTLTVNADRLYVEGITIANDSATLSPALSMTGDQQILRQVKLLGSVTVNSGRAYFEASTLQDGTLSGTARVFFSQCDLHNILIRSAFAFDRCHFTGSTSGAANENSANASYLDGWDPERVH